MAGIPISVRTARKADVRKLARALGRAFFDDPPVVWLLPDERSRERRAPGVFQAILRSHAMRYGGVDVAFDETAIAGGAIWLPPGHWAPTVGEQLRSLPGYARALGRGIGRGSELAVAMGNHHPHEEHWYLYAIGVDPARQGQGVASALLRSRLARCDADAMSAYLESTKSSNVPLYEHFGFEVTGILNPPQAAPPLTAMWRHPAGRRPGTPSVDPSNHP
jgi:ribosomal protein S18 acetylase RimI-like enzyme